MSMEKWEGPLGTFENAEDAATQKINEALGEQAAADALRSECLTFLRNTRGLKLKRGPLTMQGRRAWNQVLQTLDALEQFVHSDRCSGCNCPGTACRPLWQTQRKCCPDCTHG